MRLYGRFWASGGVLGFGVFGLGFGLGCALRAWAWCVLCGAGLCACRSSRRGVPVLARALSMRPCSLLKSTQIGALRMLKMSQVRGLPIFRLFSRYAIIALFRVFVR